MHWYTDVLSKYTVFDGRAGRQEFWMFVLCSVIVSIVVSIIGSLIHLPFLSGLYALAVLLPSLGVEIRRLHDIDKSGWWILIALVPLVGGIWLLVLLCLAGKPGPNRFGPNPNELVSVALA
jgi:uncharacterized membrane protein YhaH (DUF805 family)